MRYEHGVQVLVPYHDPVAGRQYAIFNFVGNVDRRRVKRMIRRAFVLSGINVDADTLRRIICNPYRTVPLRYLTPEELDQYAEAEA